MCGRHPDGAGPGSRGGRWDDGPCRPVVDAVVSEVRPWSESPPSSWSSTPVGRLGSVSRLSASGHSTDGIAAGEQGQGQFLYSAVSNHQDCSKHFTPFHGCILARQGAQRTDYITISLNAIPGISLLKPPLLTSTNEIAREECGRPTTEAGKSMYRHHIYLSGVSTSTQTWDM